MRKTMELLWTLILFSFFTYCLYVIKLGEGKLDRSHEKRQSESSKSFFVLPDKLIDTDKSRFSKICMNSSVRYLNDYCIVKYGNNKRAVFVENVCVENRTMVNGLQHIHPVNLKGIKGSQKFIVMYNASFNFTEQFHYFNVIFTTLPLPPWNTFSERPHVLFIPNVRKLLQNLHHFLNDFAVGVYSLMFQFNFLRQSVNR